MMASPSPMLVAWVDFLVCAMAALDKPITALAPTTNSALFETRILRFS
jgi:hypothetical protein